MTKNQAINYLYSSGFSKEQVTEIVKAFEPTTSLVDPGKLKEKFHEKISRLASN